MTIQKPTRSSFKILSDLLFADESRGLLRLFIVFQIVVVVQQLVNVLSGYYLSEAIKKIDSIENLKSSVILFLSMIILDFLLVIPIRLLEIKTLVRKHKSFLFSKIKPATLLWSSSEARDNFNSGIGSKAYHSNGGALLTLTELIKFSSSIVFNGLLFSLILDKNFLFSMFASITLGFSYQIFISNLAKKKALSMESSEISLYSYSLKAWDSVVLGNPLSASLFFKNLVKKLDQLLLMTSKNYLFSELGVFLSACLSLFPLLISNYFFLSEHSNNLVMLGAFVVLLPRQLIVVNNVRAIAQLMTFLRQDLVAVETVDRVTNLNLSTNIMARIDLDSISCNGLKLSTHPEFISSIKNKLSGRLTLTGANGSGKSSLLFYLATVLDQMFLLPASSNMEIESRELELSVGQKVLSQIQWATEHKFRYLLLDEWDANLDEANKKMIDSQLEELSQKMVIIEVRHR